jgi:hypothetical protein
LLGGGLGTRFAALGLLGGAGALALPALGGAFRTLLGGQPRRLRLLQLFRFLGLVRLFRLLGLRRLRHFPPARVDVVLLVTPSGVDVVQIRRVRTHEAD